MTDFGNLNGLSPELKILMVNAQTQLDQTRSKMKEKGLRLDLAGKMQLRDDCAELERCIKKIAKGKFKDKDAEKLKLAVIRLHAVTEGIFKE